MFARVSTYAFPPGTTREGTKPFREAISAIGELQGLLNAYLLVGDDDTVLSVTVWEDNDSLAASRVRATRLRTDAANEAGATVVSTVEYRVAERAGSLAPIA